MAIDTTDQIVQARVRNSLLKIAGKGGSPGQPYDDPEKGKGPFVPAPKRLASTQIRPNQIMLPFVPKEAETDEQYGDGVNEIELKDLQAHSPSGTYDEYGRELQIAPYKGGNPSGQQIEIPWMKEEYKKKHPELEKLHNEKYHPLQIGMNYPPPSELDKWLQLYQRNGGSLRHLDPDMRKLILQRGTMKAKGFDLGDGRSLGMPEIRALRGIFQGASEAERNKLIEKYSNRPFKGLV